MAALKALLIGSFIAMVTSYPTGAPTGACESLTPGHAASTGTNPSPFSITVSPTMYGPGDDITVTITTSGVAFRGFVIQARKSGETMPYGTFKDPAAATKLLTCTGADSSWTHSDRTDKTNVTATWTAPNSDMGTLAFVATVVQQNGGGTSIFYMNIMSSDLTYNGPTGMTPMATTPMQPQGATTPQDGMMTTEDSGVGVRGSLLLTVTALFTLALVTRRL